MAGENGPQLGNSSGIAAVPESMTPAVDYLKMAKDTVMNLLSAGGNILKGETYGDTGMQKFISEIFTANRTIGFTPYFDQGHWYLRAVPMMASSDATLNAKIVELNKDLRVVKYPGAFMTSFIKNLSASSLIPVDADKAKLEDAKVTATAEYLRLHRNDPSGTRDVKQITLDTYLTEMDSIKPEFVDAQLYTLREMKRVFVPAASNAVPSTLATQDVPNAFAQLLHSTAPIQKKMELVEKHGMPSERGDISKQTKILLDVHRKTVSKENGTGSPFDNFDMRDIPEKLRTGLSSLNSAEFAVAAGVFLWALFTNPDVGKFKFHTLLFGGAAAWVGFKALSPQFTGDGQAVDPLDAMATMMESTWGLGKEGAQKLKEMSKDLMKSFPELAKMLENSKPESLQSLMCLQYLTLDQVQTYAHSSLTSEGALVQASKDIATTLQKQGQTKVTDAMVMDLFRKGGVDGALIKRLFTDMGGDPNKDTGGDKFAKLENHYGSHASALSVMYLEASLGNMKAMSFIPAMNNNAQGGGQGGNAGGGQGGGVESVPLFGSGRIETLGSQTHLGALPLQTVFLKGGERAYKINNLVYGTGVNEQRTNFESGGEVMVYPLNAPEHPKVKALKNALIAKAATGLQAQGLSAGKPIITDFDVASNRFLSNYPLYGENHPVHFAYDVPSGKYVYVLSGTDRYASFEAGVPLAKDGIEKSIVKESIIQQVVIHTGTAPNLVLSGAFTLSDRVGNGGDIADYDATFGDVHGTPLRLRASKNAGGKVEVKYLKEGAFLPLLGNGTAGTALKDHLTQFQEQNKLLEGKEQGAESIRATLEQQTGLSVKLKRAGERVYLAVSPMHQKIFLEYGTNEKAYVVEKMVFVTAGNGEEKPLELTEMVEQDGQQVEQAKSVKDVFLEGVNQRYFGRSFLSKHADFTEASTSILDVSGGKMDMLVVEKNDKGEWAGKVMKSLPLDFVLGGVNTPVIPGLDRTVNVGGTTIDQSTRTDALKEEYNKGLMALYKEAFANAQGGKLEEIRLSKDGKTAQIFVSDKDNTLKVSYVYNRQPDTAEDGLQGRYAFEKVRVISTPHQVKGAQYLNVNKPITELAEGVNKALLGKRLLKKRNYESALSATPAEIDQARGLLMSGGDLPYAEGYNRALPETAQDKDLFKNTLAGYAKASGEDKFKNAPDFGKALDTLVDQKMNPDTWGGAIVGIDSPLQSDVKNLLGNRTDNLSPESRTKVLILMEWFFEQEGKGLGTDKTISQLQLHDSSNGEVKKLRDFVVTLSMVPEKTLQSLQSTNDLRVLYSLLLNPYYAGVELNAGKAGFNQYEPSKHVEEMDTVLLYVHSFETLLAHPERYSEMSSQGWWKSAMSWTGAQWDKLFKVPTLVPVETQVSYLAGTQMTHVLRTGDANAVATEMNRAVDEIYKKYVYSSADVVENTKQLYAPTVEVLSS